MQEREVPAGELDRRLREFAARYHELRLRLQELAPADPEVARIYKAAATAMEEGEFDRAEHLLNEGSDTDLAAARAAQHAARSRFLSAAAAKARNGDLKRAQLAYAEAAVYYRQAVELTPQDAREDIAQYLIDLGSTHLEAGEHVEAEENLERGLNLQEEIFGATYSELTSVLNWLGILRYEQGRFVDSEKLHRRALAIEEALGEDRPGVATQLDHIANAMQRQGKFEFAEQLLARALAVNERILGPNHTDVGYTLLAQANAFYFRAGYAEAKTALRRAIGLFQEGLGPEHPDLAAAYDMLANVFDAQGRFRDSAPLRARALMLWEKVKPNHPKVAIILTNVGLWYFRQGFAAEALRYYGRALEIQETLLGNTHVQVGTTLHNIAMALHSLGRFGEAEPLERRALAIKEAALDRTHPDVAAMLVGLAAILEKLRRFDEADPLFGRALIIREAKFGPDHPEVATSLYKYAMCFGAQGRFAEAEPLLKRALAIRRRLLPMHPETLELTNNLATTLMTLKIYNEAEPLLLSLIATLEQNDQPSLLLHAARLNYAEVLHRTGRIKKARQIESLIPRHLFPRPRK
jgi:tetratricopeptide (TPR) repeat protein